jgi:hypothetical protein
MGHANLSNISEFFIKRLYAKGRLSVAQCVAAMRKKKVMLQASEGAYEDYHMLCLGVEQVIQFLDEFNPAPSVLDRLSDIDDGPVDGIYGPVIVPVSLTPEQSMMLSGMRERDLDDPDQYEIFDSIEWKFAPGWRNVYPDIPMLGCVTN